MSLPPVERETIKVAATCFVEGEFGLALTNRLFDLGGALIVHGNPSRMDAARSVIRIQDKLYAYAVLADRLRQSKAQHDNATLDESALRIHAAVDLEGMLVTARSSLDHVAILLDAIAPKRGQLPPSFRPLREHVGRYENKLPPGVAGLIRDAHWFDTLRRARDGVVHDGAQTIVFPPGDDRLAFQVYGLGNRPLIVEPSSMVNPYIVDVERFLAMTFAHWIVLLDRLGDALCPLVTGAESRRASVAYSPSYAVLRQWIHAIDVAEDDRAE